MKIAVIHGQSHKGSTYQLGHALAEEIAGEKDIREFFLPTDLNHFCIGCYQCLEDESRCPFYQEKQTIMQAVEACDVLIITTPTYCMSPSAPLKAFIDLTFTYWMSHKPRECMFYKKAVILSTAAGAGASDAIKPVKRTLFYWGIPWIKTYGAIIHAKDWNSVSDKKKAKIKKDIKKIARAISAAKKVHVPFRLKALFRLMTMMQKNNMGSSPAEKQYWEEHNWLGKERPWK